MTARKRKKPKITLRVSHKKPRDPVAAAVTKRRAGPIKDRRKVKPESDSEE